MARTKCAMCGQYKPLIGDLCAECKSVRAYDVNERVKKMLSDLTATEDDFGSGGSCDFAGMNQVFVKKYNKEKEAKERIPTYDEAYQEIFNRIVTANKLPADLVKKFKPQLNFLVKRYMFHFLSGSYFLSDKESFKREHNGEVIEVKGRWVVYKVAVNRQDGIIINLNDNEELAKGIDRYVQQVLEAEAKAEQGNTNED